MDTKKAGAALTVGGVAIVVAAVFWWMTFYSKVMGGQVGSAFPCLFSSSEECQFVSMMGRMGGLSPYTPFLFWVGAIVAIVGVFLLIASLAAMPATTDGQMSVPAQDIPPTTPSEQPTANDPR